MKNKRNEPGGGRGRCRANVYVTWKGCLGPWMVVREEVQEQVLPLLQLHGKVPTAREGRVGRDEQTKASWKELSQWKTEKD